MPFPPSLFLQILLRHFIHCLVALLWCFQHLLESVEWQTERGGCLLSLAAWSADKSVFIWGKKPAPLLRVELKGVMQGLGFCLAWSQEGIFTCMLTLLLYTLQLPEGTRELRVTTAQHHQNTHKSRRCCPFLTGFKWSIVFYSNSLLTFILWLLPRWVTGHWSPCSATCEKGVQHREVTCVYQLQNGTYVNTRDLYCLGSKPATVQSCEGRDCLSIWEASEWSKVGTALQKGARLLRALDTLASIHGSHSQHPHSTGVLGRTLIWDEQCGAEIWFTEQVS